MNPKSSSLLAWIGVILAGFAVAVAFIAISDVSKVQTAASGLYGSNSSGGPVFNAGASFPLGLQLGSQKENTSAGTLTIAAGQNQASWCNTGAAAVVFDTWAYLAGTTTNAITASTYKLYVGTSTTAKPPVNDYTSWYAGLINGALFATSTATNQVIADNSASHAGTVASSVAVQSGQCIVAQVQQTYGCTADSGTCKTATSTNRGWATMSIPFYYKSR